jgi:alpha-beta hydrolase superfamily lysophospholipase
MNSRGAALAINVRPLLLLLAFLGCDTPRWGANALLHPARRASHGIPDGTESFETAGDPVLKGWWARGKIPRRGLILWLHGVGDNKDSAEGLIERWAPRGFDVAAYDSRAHGASAGDTCTYGYYEKDDVKRVLDVLQKAGADADRTLLIGVSMGGAVALQAAPLDGRIRAVAAVSPFASLNDAARRAAPFWMGQSSVEKAFALVEKEGHFSIADVSPQRSVDHLTVPLLLVHGKRDSKIPPADSQAILGRALSRDKQLVIIDDADHDHLLDHKEAWAALDQFVDRVGPVNR